MTGYITFMHRESAEPMCWRWAFPGWVTTCCKSWSSFSTVEVCSRRTTSKFGSLQNKTSFSDELKESLAVTKNNSSLTHSKFDDGKNVLKNCHQFTVPILLIFTPNISRYIFKMRFDKGNDGLKCHWIKKKTKKQTFRAKQKTKLPCKWVKKDMQSSLSKRSPEMSLRTS